MCVWFKANGSECKPRTEILFLHIFSPNIHSILGRAWKCYFGDETTMKSSSARHFTERAPGKANTWRGKWKEPRKKPRTAWVGIRFKWQEERIRGFSERWRWFKVSTMFLFSGSHLAEQPFPEKREQSLRHFRNYVGMKNIFHQCRKYCEATTLTVIHSPCPVFRTCYTVHSRLREEFRRF